MLQWCFCSSGPLFHSAEMLLRCHYWAGVMKFPLISLFYSGDISGSLWGEELIAVPVQMKVHDTSYMSCLHVRDSHLKGLMVVARQQPFSQPFLWSYIDVLLSAVISETIYCSFIPTQEQINSDTK